MSDEQWRELEDIAKMLVEAREKLEKLQSGGNVPETDALHTAISHAHWLCYRISHNPLPERTCVFGGVCPN